jgi:hypothetical protein
VPADLNDGHVAVDMLDAAFEGTLEVTARRSERRSGRLIWFDLEQLKLAGLTRRKGRITHVDQAPLAAPVEGIVLADASRACRLQVPTTPVLDCQSAVITMEFSRLRRASSRVPTDLRAAMAAEGLTLEGMGERDVRHLVSMVREARDPTVRRARIADVIGFLRSRG